jgi:hypothetical protein
MFVAKTDELLPQLRLYPYPHPDVFHSFLNSKRHTMCIHSLPYSYTIEKGFYCKLLGGIDAKSPALICK